jgi:hypothetical protein
MSHHTLKNPAVIEATMLLTIQTALNEIDEDEDEVDDLINIAVNAAMFIYATTGAIQKPLREKTPTSSHWLHNILPKYNDKKFLEILRMKRIIFKKLVSEIEDHPIFRGNSANQQAPAHVQVSVLLKRLGGLMTHTELAILFGISEGSVDLYCIRSITAIIDNLGAKYVHWPQDNDRHKVHAGFKSFAGLPKVIGAIDCTQIPFHTAPNNHKTSYWSRKMKYSLNVQATVNHLSLFTSFYVGWPGSCHNRRIFCESFIFQQHKKLMHNDYIIGDDGYKPCTPYLICPYPKPKPSEDRKKIFNVKLSKTRVVVEHAFGHLKVNIN